MKSDSTKGTILIVEDEEFVLQLEKRKLESAGYAVLTAKTTEEASQRISDEAIDLIILDNILGAGLTGLEFYAELKKKGNEIPVIVVTGFNDEVTIIKALRAGARDFITKSKAYLDYLPEAVERILIQERTKRALAQSEEERKNSASLLLSTLEATADGILAVNKEGKIRSFNKRFEEMWGIPPEAPAAHDGQTAIAFIIEQLKNPDEFASKTKELDSLPLAQSCDTLEFKDGRVFELLSMPQMLEGKAVGRVWSIRDITERKKAEERLSYLAHHDALTDLPNRILLQDRLRQALAQAQRTGRKVALLFLDLDRFKAINDTFGHEVGDLLIKEVAERLTKVVRQSDTVARLGGDEFTIILTNPTQDTDAAKVSQKLLNVLSLPFRLGPEIFVTASIGITVYPSDGEDISSLLKNADAAMYRAKESGRNNYKFYTADMNAKAFERLALENDLRHALERKEFRLHYQPQVDLRSGRIVGVEALVRWERPSFGLVSPAQFIPVAEETSLIVPIGEWVLQTACAQNQAWRATGLPPIRMVVNISGCQFKQSRLIDTLAGALKETGLPAQYLGLELTESVVMQNVEATLAALREMNSMGIEISIDDFGTGYSSLSYLKRFPVHILKIDPSFVRDITAHATDAAIATSIITLAHSLNMKVIAEGVETKEQMAFLKVHGCDGMQGYFFSKPLPPEGITKLLQEGKKLSVLST